MSLSEGTHLALANVWTPLRHKILSKWSSLSAYLLANKGYISGLQRLVWKTTMLSVTICYLLDAYLWKISTAMFTSQWFIPRNLTPYCWGWLHRAPEEQAISLQHLQQLPWTSLVDEGWYCLSALLNLDVLKRIQNPHSLFWDFGADKTLQPVGQVAALVARFKFEPLQDSDCLRRTCYHSCNTDSLIQSKSF